MRMFALLLFTAMLFAQTTSTGFSVSATPVSETDPFAHQTRYGIVIAYSSDAPDTVGFAAEIRYTLPDDPGLFVTNSFAMPNFAKQGHQYLWIGQPATLAISAIEIKSFGRQATF